MTIHSHKSQKKKGGNLKERQKNIKVKYSEIKGNYKCGQRKLREDYCVLGPDERLK